jgi:hypothetical protein
MAVNIKKDYIFIQHRWRPNGEPLPYSVMQTNRYGPPRSRTFIDIQIWLSNIIPVDDQTLRELQHEYMGHRFPYDPDDFELDQKDTFDEEEVAVKKADLESWLTQDVAFTGGQSAGKQFKQWREWRGH